MLDGRVVISTCHGASPPVVHFDDKGICVHGVGYRPLRFAYFLNSVSTLKMTSFEPNAAMLIMHYET